MQTAADTFLLQPLSALRTHQMVEHASAVSISGITHLKYALKVTLRCVVPVFQHIAMLKTLICKSEICDVTLKQRICSTTDAAHDWSPIQCN